MASNKIFGGLGKIYLLPEGLGPMNHQILRAHVKKSGGDLVTTLDSSVSIICAHKTVPKETLQLQINNHGASKAACVDVSWISDCIRANKFVQPTVLLGNFKMPGQDAIVDVTLETSARAEKRQFVNGDTAESITKKIKTSECQVTIVASKGADTWNHNNVKCFVRWFSPNFSASSKVAAFDMDGVIIVPKSNKKFPENHNDWRLLREGILIKKLKSLIDEGYCIVLISNQKGMEKGKPTVAQLSEKITNIQRALTVPITFIASYSNNEYRKPAPGMWHELVRDFKRVWSVDIDPTQCLFVGDAAGRGEGKKEWSGWAVKDFSDSDRKFALNAGIKFHCPESFFLGTTPMPYRLSGFDPTPYLSAPAADGPGGGNAAAATAIAAAASSSSSSSSSAAGASNTSTATASSSETPAAAAVPAAAELTAPGQEMVLLVGWPGSGKTTLVSAVFQPAGYVWVNRDTLKTVERCKKEAAAALAAGRSVVIDNTNPSARARAEFVGVAHGRGVPVRCVQMAAGRELSQHLNEVRTLLGPGPGRPVHDHVPVIAYNDYGAKYEAPSPSAEGFAGPVVQVPFVARFESEEARRVFGWRL